jgi:Fic family protein
MSAIAAQELATVLSGLESAKAELDALRPLPEYTLASLRDKLALEWTYNSNAIEGNTLTLRETKVVLEGITVGGKTLREHFEAINHHEAIFFVEALVAKPEPLSEQTIKSIHHLVLKGINDAEAGQYRRENVVITGASTVPPHFLHLQDEMRDLIEWYQNADALHPVVRAAELHTRFVAIHPFVDGNGRTGRLLMNLDLMMAGFPPAVIRKEDREEYYDALDTACLYRDFDPITALVAESVSRALALYLDLMRPEPQPSPNSSPRFR